MGTLLFSDEEEKVGKDSSCGSKQLFFVVILFSVCFGRLHYETSAQFIILTRVAANGHAIKSIRDCTTQIINLARFPASSYTIELITTVILSTRFRIGRINERTILYDQISCVGIFILHDVFIVVSPEHMHFGEVVFNAKMH